MTLTLPWPPSVNHYYARNRNGSTRISEAGRAYRWRVVAECRKAGLAKALPGRVHVAITAHPPDARRRDLDNTLKATLDAMQYAGVYVDDAQVDHLSIERGAVEKGGRLKVLVWDVQ